MKKTSLVLVLITLGIVLMMFISCGQSVSGRYYLTEETYHYAIEELLKEKGVTKDHKDYEKIKESYLNRYSMETIEYNICRGKDFSLEFKNKSVISHVAVLNYQTKEYNPIEATMGTYEVKDGKIYVSSKENGFDNLYIGYIADGVLWYAPDSNDYVLPLYQK